MPKPSTADTLRELATAQAGPRWLHLIGYLGVAVTTALGVYSQVQDQFPEWFEPENVGMVEYRHHFAEEPVDQFFEVAGLGMIKVQFFASDRCLLVTRSGQAPEWFPDRPFTPGPSPTATILPVDPPGTVHAAEQGGRCWNGPHPGRSRQRRGDPENINGVRWVKVFTEFDDGCVMYQYLREDGWWDVNPDGSPRITWVRCVH